METASRNGIIILRLDHDEDILASVAALTNEISCTFVIVGGIGMIHDFELGYFDRGRYTRKDFREPHELLSLQGSVSSEGEPRIHIHATVADAEHEAFGGHLMKGKAWMSNEIFMAQLEGIRSVREIDPEKCVGILRLRT